MKIRALDKEMNTPNATIEMSSGDRLSIGVLNGGEYQIINVSVQGSVAVIEHEQSGDALVVRPRGAQYVKA